MFGTFSVGRILLFLSIFLCVFQISGQPQKSEKIGAVIGQVTEKTSGFSIPNVKVSAAGNEAATDNEGNFRLELPVGVYNLRFQAQGFADILTAQITVTANRNFVQNVQLEITASEKVEVKIGSFEVSSDQQISQASLNRDEIRTTPGTGGDPLRAINSLPSVTIQSAEFSDLIVRGGSVGENLTFIDNIPVGDFTLFTDRYDNGRGGRASFLAPDVISRADFSAGGFGVRYGDRLSSALDVSLREPNREKFQGVFFADSGGAGVSFEVPLGKRGGWLTSIRRSYIDVAFDIAEIGDIGKPRNWDIINRVTYDLNERHKISFTALNLFEDFTLDEDLAANSDRRFDRLTTGRRSRRAIFGATLSTTFGKSTLSQITAWASGQHADASYFLPFFNRPQRSRDLRDSEFGIKEELTSSLSPKLQLAAGGGLIFNQADYHTFEENGSLFSPLEEEFNSPARNNRFHLPTRVSAYGYGQLTWRPAARFSVTPQIRVDRYGITDQILVSPRINANYQLTDRLAVNFAAGVYRQTPTVFQITQSPENPDLKAQKAVHFIGGIDWLAREDIRVRAEVFRKNYSNLIIRPIINSLSFYDNTGEGTADGVEISAQKALSGGFAGQISYSFVRSRRSLCENCFAFPADTERPHQFTAIGITRFFGIIVGAKYRFASGLPFTVRTPVQPIPNASFFLQRISRVEDINAGRLPDYSNLDVRVEKKFDFRRWSIAPYLDIFNVLRFRNNTELNYEFFSPTPFRLGENDALPIFGLRIEF